MRFLADLTASGTPAERTATAIGSMPERSSGRWLDTGIEIARWRLAGPHQFTYGQQSRHCIAFVSRPLGHHLLTRDNRVIREGKVHPGRFRLSAPGDEIVAQVTTADPIDMTHVYFSHEALEGIADALEFSDDPIRLVDPTWDSRNTEIEAALKLMQMGLFGAAAPDWARLEMLASYVMSTILRSVSRYERTTALPRRRSARIERAISFIDDNIARPIQLADIAAAACLSQFHLCRAFRDATGLAPHAYLQERRLSEARRLLHESSYGLDEIAFRTGFASAGSLAGAIRRKFGMGPTRLRRTS
jgi:AraC family transcriptional regulator